MATATGTASTAVDLLNKLNTFLTANGWTKIRGETDMACASPKAARYWRILVAESDGNSDIYREIKSMQWRTTSGGANVATVAANYSVSASTGGAFDLVAGSFVQALVYDQMWWVQYDFGSATTIREIVIQANQFYRAPAEFLVQWSNDAKSWTTMYQVSDYSWSVFQESKTYTWDTGSGYLDSRHASASLPRRSGSSYYVAGGSFNQYTQWSDDIWCWQGPGYDASRRVYISAIPFFNLATSDEKICFAGSTDIDASGIPQASWFQSQEGMLANTLDNDTPTHIMSSSGVTYWFYCNSKRFIVVTRSGVDDYTMTYAGFMSAFAQPDDYPFPLLVASSTDSANQSLNTAGTFVRDAQDPSFGAAYYRGYDNAWKAIGNHDQAAAGTENWSAQPQAVVWPKHIGVGGRANYPQNVMGDHVDNEGHWLKNTDPTVQGDLPVIPCIIADRGIGFVGAMDGVFVIPQGGVLAPEGTFTIGADTYRVFSTRALADGNQYYCIKEV